MYPFPSAKLFRLVLGVALLAGAALTVPRLPHALAAPLAYSVRSDVDDQLYQIDMATGVATAIGPVGFTDVEGLAFDCAGALYGVDDITDQLISINLATGAGTAIGPLGIGGVGVENDFGLAFDFAGNAWLSTDVLVPAMPPVPAVLGNFYSVNPATGAATLVGAQGRPVTGLAVSAGGVIYGLGGDQTNVLVTINPATGAATVVGPLGGAVSLFRDGGIDFDAGGTLWGLGDPGHTTPISPSEIFTINTANGTATFVATVTLGGIPIDGFENLAINTLCPPTPTPTFTSTNTNTPGPSPTPLPTNTPAPTNPPPPTHTPAPTNPPQAIVDPYLTKAADPQFAQVGDVVQFTLIVTNPNVVELANSVLVDQLPPEFDFINATTTHGTFAFDAASNTVTFNLGTLAAGQSVTMILQARVNDKAQLGSALRNVAVLTVNGQFKGQAEAFVQIIPSTIPLTGVGYSTWRLGLAGLAFVIGAGAGWWLRKRRK